MNKLAVTKLGACFFIMFGISVNNNSYYLCLYTFYTVALINKYVKDKNTILDRYTHIKVEVIIFLDILQELLLAVLLLFVIDTFICYLKSVWGYIIKMAGEQVNINTKPSGNSGGRRWWSFR